MVSGANLSIVFEILLACPGQALQVGGLHCDVGPAWSQLVLEQIAASVEQLEVVCPAQQHLRAICLMPRLAALYVQGHCSDSQLRQLPPQLQQLHVARVTR